jgi:iron complex transport system ATP-binding protein
MRMNGNSPASVDAQGVSFSVEAKTLLDRVDVRAERGQFVGLIGPNGAGKSTLLRTLSGVLRNQEGTVWLEGADLQSMPARDVAAMLALVPQIAPYTQGFTAFELVLMGRYPHLGRFQVEGQTDDRIAKAAMRLTETEQFEKRTLDTLSGGERQRVFLARALAQQPRILLLDEPTSNLDILHQLTILGLVRKLVDEGLTAIAAIHDLNLAARYFDHLVLINGGTVVTEGRPEEVLTPETIESAFGVRAAVYRDPVTEALAISLIGPAEGNGSAFGPGAGEDPRTVAGQNGVSSASR